MLDMADPQSGSKLRIGWIGTGVMGAPMAGHLLSAGHELTIYSRTRSRAEPLLAHGASWASSPAVAAAGADVVFSIVGFPADVRAIHLGAYGTLTANPPPARIVDMTTSEPSLALEIADTATAVGVGSLDAPVSGGDIGARNASLSIMVGGEKADFEAVRPLLQHLGKTIIHHGGPGTGQHAKMVNQILIASTMIGVCEGLIYAVRAGLDPARVIESVGSGAAGSWSINNLGPRMIRGDFAPGFFVEHFLKDLGIALNEARTLRLALPGLNLARELYENLPAMGHGRSGTQALFLALQAMNSA